PVSHVIPSQALSPTGIMEAGEEFSARERTAARGLTQIFQMITRISQSVALAIVAPCRHSIVSIVQFRLRRFSIVPREIPVTSTGMTWSAMCLGSFVVACALNLMSIRPDWVMTNLATEGQRHRTPV